MEMSTHKIKGEDYYQCRDVKAERDKLLEEVAELRDSLEAAEKDVALKERIIDSLGKELNAVTNNLDDHRALVSVLREEVTKLRAEVIHWKEQKEPGAAGWRALARKLQAKIKAMEKQEPVAWMSSRNGFIVKENKNPDYNLPLIHAPSAKGE